VEKKPFGQGFQDAVYGGVRSVYENPTVQKIGGKIKEGFFDIYDPFAAKVTEVGLPLLQTLTPENPTTQAARDEILYGIEPYKPSPEGMSMMDRLGAQYDRMIADFGAAGQAMFGQARNAAEKLDQGIPFEDLTPEEQRAARIFGFEVATLVSPTSLYTKPATLGAATTVKTLGKTLIDKDSGLRLSAGPQNAAERISSLQSVAKVQPLTAEQKVELASLFKGMKPKVRAEFARLIPPEDLDDVLKMVKMDLKPGKQGGYGTYGIIEKDGVVGKNLKFPKSPSRFVPIENLKLTIRAPGTKKEGEFDFFLLEKGKLEPNPEQIKERLSAANIVGKELQDKARAEEAQTIMDVYANNKNLPIRSKTGESLKSKVNEAIDPSTRKYRPNQQVSESYIREILNEYGLRPIVRKAPDTDIETKRDITKGLTKLTGDKSKGIMDPFNRSLNAKEFPTLARIEEFFTSQNINMKNIKRPLDEPRLFNAIESNRVALQDSLKQNKFIQQVLKDRGETKSLTFNKSHMDRSIKPVTEADQFRGLDPTDVKILGETVNNFVQNDFEIVLLRKIKEKDVAGTKDMIDAMKEFFIATKLNDPRRPGLTKEDYQWLDKNKLITVPTIKPGSRGAPFKNYDAVIFGTKDQPNVKQLVEGELAARDYYKNKTKFEADFPGKVYTDFYAEGGLVGDMIPVKASTGFFAKLFGKTPKFRQEGMDVSDVFGATKAQQQTLEQLYPGQAFPDYVPGEVFYSNLDLSLSKRDAPLIFNTNKEFRDYMNQSGVGVDELNDAKVLNFVNSKFKEGQPVLAKDLLDISSQSPVRNVYIDGYGFRSDKVNKAPKTELDYTGSVRVKEGDPVQKSANYPSQGLLDGFDDGTYKERVLRINKGNLRGDTGSVPGGTAHSFGNEYDDGANNYVIAWTRQTDRSGKIIPGQTIDRETGDLVTAGQLADQTRLGELEKRINRLFEDPITSLNPDDMAGVTAAVNRLVEKNPNLTQSRAFNIVNQQITSKQKELKKLQNQYNEEAARIKGFKPEAEQEVKLTVIDELQSDVMQSMNRKARELAARLEVMAEDGIPLTQMRDKELLEYFQATGDIRRPVGKTKTELMNQYNELMNMQKQLTALSRQPAYAITPANINLYRDTIKGRQAELIDQMSEEISNDLMRSLFPDLPFKDRVQYADALSKQAIAESAYRLFVEKDPNAPRFIGFMSGEVVAGDAYGQTGRTSTSIAERKSDKLNRIDAFKREIRGGNERAKIAPSGLPGVGTDEFYGGPLSKSRVGDGVEVDEIGGHYTSTMESVFKKIANQYGSELKIINVAASKPRRVTSYRIISQDTGAEVGRGETYRQAERIANDLVDNEGGRYIIDSKPIFEYDTRPIFGMEITPQMLQLFKAYK